MAKQVPFYIQSGIPFARTIEVTLPNGRAWWTALVDFEVLGQIREAPAFTSPLLVDLKQFLTVSLNVDVVTIELVMTAADTRKLLQNGYYDIMLSDAFTTDERAFVAVAGPVYQSFVVSSDVEETVI